MFSDVRIPDEARVWLKSGKQSIITEKIAEEASEIEGINRRERLYRGMAYIWSSFQYNPLHNGKMLVNNAHKLFEKDELGGCIDYALVELTFFRALDIPARIVVTANIDWISAYMHNSLSMPEGHAFLEVYLEGRWFLLDPAYRILYLQYDLSSAYYPRGEIFCGRGNDFWSMGIETIDELNKLMKGCADKYTDGSYKAPAYTEQKI